MKKRFLSDDDDENKKEETIKHKKMKTSTLEIRSTFGRAIWSKILEFCDTPEWLQLSYTCKEINQFKFHRSYMLNKIRKVRYHWEGIDVEHFFRLAKGTLFNVHFNENQSVTDKHFQFLESIHTLNMSGCRKITGRAFSYLIGIHTLNISGCWKITDRAFSYLSGIHTLDMSGCRNITDDAFCHLRGIHTLNMSGCRNITDDAFCHLSGIHTLNMSGCSNITDRAFSYLSGIHTLDMSDCWGITDRAFSYLSGIHTLDMSGCWKITDDAFCHLSGIHTLNMSGCIYLTDRAFSYLSGIHTLDMSGCWKITDDAFCHLSGIHTLDMSDCWKITDDAFCHLSGIHTLNMSGCSNITDRAFSYLSGIHTLDVSDCWKITDDAFCHLSGIHTLNMSGCIYLTDRAFSYLSGIHTLDMSGCRNITDRAFYSLEGVHTRKLGSSYGQKTISERWYHRNRKIWSHSSRDDFTPLTWTNYSHNAVGALKPSEDNEENTNNEGGEENEDELLRQLYRQIENPERFCRQMYVSLSNMNQYMMGQSRYGPRAALRSYQNYSSKTKSYIADNEPSADREIFRKYISGRYVADNYLKRIDSAQDKYSEIMGYSVEKSWVVVEVNCRNALDKIDEEFTSDILEGHVRIRFLDHEKSAPLHDITCQDEIGTPECEGTVGAVIKHEDDIYGLTCAHNCLIFEKNTDERQTFRNLQSAVIARSLYQNASIEFGENKNKVSLQEAGNCEVFDPRLYDAALIKLQNFRTEGLTQHEIDLPNIDYCSDGDDVKEEFLKDTYCVHIGRKNNATGEREVAIGVLISWDTGRNRKESYEKQIHIEGRDKAFGKKGDSGSLVFQVGWEQGRFQFWPIGILHAVVKTKNAYVFPLDNFLKSSGKNSAGPDNFVYIYSDFVEKCITSQHKRVLIDGINENLSNND